MMDVDLLLSPKCCNLDNVRLLTISISLVVLLFYPPIYRQQSDNEHLYATTLDYMSVSDAMKSTLIFQCIASVVNVILIQSSNISIRAIRCIIGHIIGIVLFTLILFCCGAPIFVKTWNWKELSLNQLSYDIYILSMLLSTLTFMPLFIKCSFDTNNVRIVIMDIKSKPNYSNNTAFSYPFWSTIIGCIIASYILALDWFRPYQQFPLPCLMGACCGHCIGYLSIFVLPICCPHNIFNARKKE